MSAAEQEVQEELDIRGELEAAMQSQSEEVEEQEEAPEEEGRARDDKGRFVAKEQVEAAPLEEKEPVGEVAEPEADAQEAKEAEPALAPPNGWSADAKAKWHELPEEVQRATLKREEDIAKFTSTRDEHASFGKEMYQAVQPYMAQIQAEGGTPTSAVQSLLNTAYVLRTGSPEQKRTLLLQTARQFGVDLVGVTEKEQSEVPPYVQQLNQRFERLESSLTQRDQQEQQRLQTEVQSEIEAFAADPKNSHFETVKGHMAALIGQGLAKDLQDAYDQACWANSDVRATLTAQERAAEEQKRRAEANRKAQEAKRKGISLTGGPGNTAAKSAPEERSLREELEANMAASSGAV